MARRRNHYRDRFSRGRMSANQTLLQLREIGEHVAQAAKDALKQGAEIVVAEAKNRCPVKTGALRDSIQAESKNNGAAFLISANAFKTDRFGRRYFYGQNVEFDPKIDKPFLYPAMDAKRDEVYSGVKDAISDAIRRGT